MFYVNILISLKDKKFYIGFTNNLKRRLNEHNSGKNISTKSRLPLKLIYYESHLSKADVERREKYFKTTKGKSNLKPPNERIGGQACSLLTRWVRVELCSRGVIWPERFFSAVSDTLYTIILSQITYFLNF